MFAIRSALRCTICTRVDASAKTYDSSQRLAIGESAEESGKFEWHRIGENSDMCDFFFFPLRVLGRAGIGIGDLVGDLCGTISAWIARRVESLI